MRIHVNNKGIWHGRFVLYMNGDKRAEMEARDSEDVCFEVKCSTKDTIGLECMRIEMEDTEIEKEIEVRRAREDTGEEDAMYDIMTGSHLFYSACPYISEFEVIDPNKECEVVFKELAQSKGLYYMATEDMHGLRPSRLVLRGECSGKQLWREFIRSIGSGLSLFPIFVGIPIGLSVLIYILTRGVDVTESFTQRLIGIAVVLLFMLGVFMAIGGFHIIGEVISEYQFLRDNPVIRLDGGKKGHKEYKERIDFYIDP